MVLNSILLLFREKHHSPIYFLVLNLILLLIDKILLSLFISWYSIPTRCYLEKIFVSLFIFWYLILCVYIHIYLRIRCQGFDLRCILNILIIRYTYLQTLLYKFILVKSTYVTPYTCFFLCVCRFSIGSKYVLR